MIGILVASHGRLADEMLNTARQIVGDVPCAAAFSIPQGQSSEDIRSQLQQAVRTLDAGEGVLVFADLFGGTPCNQSLALCQQAHIEVLTGVNLPMLVKANSLRKNAHDLRSLALELIRYGQQNITCASALLEEKRNSSTPA